MCPHPPPSSARHTPAHRGAGNESKAKPSAAAQQRPTTSRHVGALPKAPPAKRVPTQMVPIAHPPPAASRARPTKPWGIAVGMADADIRLPMRKSTSYRDLDNGFCPRNCANCGHSFVKGDKPRFEEFCSGECLYSSQLTRWRMRTIAKRRQIRQQLTEQQR